MALSTDDRNEVIQLIQSLIAGRKVSELDALTALNDADTFYVIEAASGESKKVSKAVLAGILAATGVYWSLIDRSGADPTKLPAFLAALTGTTSNDWTLGDGAAGDKRVVYDNGNGGANPWVGLQGTTLGFFNGTSFTAFGSVDLSASQLTGLGAGTNVPISATDNVLVAFAKLQNQINNLGAPGAKNSVTYDSGELQFLNDVDNPGNDKVYGTDGAGTKGWFDKGAGGPGGANLSYTSSPTEGQVNSDSGTDATLPAANGTNAGLLLPADKTKLDNTPADTNNELGNKLESVDLGYTPSPTNGTVTNDAGINATVPLADGTNAGLMTPAEKNQLASLPTTNPFRGTFISSAALITAIPTGNEGDYANVDPGAGTDAIRYIWDNDTNTWVASGGIGGGSTNLTYNAGTIESDTGTDATIPDATSSLKGLATDVQITKLDATETSAQLDARDTANRNRANHTGSQAISTITDLQTTLDDKIQGETQSTIGAGTLTIVADAEQEILIKHVNIPIGGSNISTVDITGAKLVKLTLTFRNLDATEKTVTFPSGVTNTDFQFDVSTGGLNVVTIPAGQTVKISAARDPLAIWRASASIDVSSLGADTKLVSQDITWAATNTHNVNSGYDAAVFGGSPANCIHNITNASLNGIHKGLISYDLSLGGTANEVTFQKDGVATDCEVFGSANSVATLGIGPYTLFSWAMKKINATKTIIVITKMDK